VKRTSKRRRISQGLRGIPGPPGPAGQAGATGEKGDTGSQGMVGDIGHQGLKGETGLRGPEGDQGRKGDTGSQGVGGPRGHAGLTGADGAIGPAGRATNLQELAKQVAYVDRSIENIYNELGSHIERMTYLQRELDNLRDTVRKLATRMETVAGAGNPVLQMPNEAGKSLPLGFSR